METFASLGAGLVAFLGAAGLLWGMSNSTRKENKADITKLGDDTDRKIAEVAQIIANSSEAADRKIATLGEATDRKIAANAEAIVVLREITAKNSSDIAALRESIAVFREETRESNAALRESIAKNSADIATPRESNTELRKEMRESIAEFRQEMREFREEMRANTQSIVQALAQR